MSKKYRVVTRWKVRHVHRSDLQTVLNKLARDGWDVVDVMVSFGRFTIVSKRRVREKL